MAASDNAVHQELPNWLVDHITGIIWHERLYSKGHEHVLMRYYANNRLSQIRLLKGSVTYANDHFDQFRAHGRNVSKYQAILQNERSLLLLSLDI